MATLSLTNISSILNLIFADAAADQFNRAYPVLQLFTVRNGQNALATWPVKFRTRTAGGFYTEGADMASGDYDFNTRLQASHPWAQIRKGARVSGLSQAAAGSSGGLPIDVELVQDEIRDAVDSLFLDLNTYLYSGNVGASPAQLAGLAAGVDSSTAAPYAGIDGATYTDWKSAEASIATASLNVANIRNYLLNPVRDATGKDPTFVLCHGTPYNLIETIADQTGEAPLIRIAGRMRPIREISNQFVTVRGVPFIYDQYATSNTMYAITQDDIEIRQLPQQGQLYTSNPQQAAINAKLLAGLLAQMENNSLQVDEAEIMQDLLAQSQRIQPAVHEVAKAGDADNFMITSYLQMIYKRRNSHAKLVLT